MAEKLGLGPEVRELKLGASFTNPRSTAFHTVRYDFKPASVDVNKSATIDVGSNNQITVNVPHLDGAGTSQTVFKGSQKPYQKECVLIIDKSTGKITLERLTSNIQVKKTRSEALHKPLPPHLADKLEPSPNSSSSSSSSKMGSKLSGGNKSRKERQSLPISKHSPRHPASSPASHHSPARSRSPVKREPVSLPPPPAPKSASASPVAPPSLAASLPLIGMDDFPMVSKPAERMEKLSPYSKPYKATPPAPEPTTNKGKPTGAGAGALSDSSSSSSSSSDDSESDNDVNTKRLVNNFGQQSLHSEIKVSDSSDSDSDDDDDHETHHVPVTKPSMPAMTNPIDHVLNEDLCLSESGSESD
ncbi:ell-associated factor Eaf-like [Chrysoperla carnea]|uniref:ell-associated factor Eaf-like n=1 Tax=Chrysoperla carnea TaxID=189513 RepID=UPI001D05EE3B|nr:ell-associated factor Eaf-like [Chrysoperla carnea]